MAKELTPSPERIDLQRPVKRTRYEAKLGLFFSNPLSIVLKAGISVTKEEDREREEKRKGEYRLS